MAAISHAADAAAHDEGGRDGEESPDEEGDESGVRENIHAAGFRALGSRAG